MNFKEFLLNEMRVHRYGDDPSTVLAFRDNVWIYDRGYEEIDDLAQEIWNTVQKAFAGRKLPKQIEDRLNEKEVTIDDVESFFKDWLRDGLQGWLDDDHLTITIGDDPSPVSSPLMKKVAQSIGAKSVGYEAEEVYKNPYSGNGEYGETPHDYDTIQYNYNVASDMYGNVPETMWHGTTTEYYLFITKFGLMPGQSPSNFARNNVFHDDKIFLADRESEARYYAANAIKEQGGYPMVIHLKVPDPSKLLPDYDVDRYSVSSLFGKNTYANLGHQDREWEISSVSPWKSTKHAGKYAYQGRIPASHILGIKVRFGKDNWQQIDIPYANKLMSNYGKEGWDYYGFDLDELDEEE